MQIDDSIPQSQTFELPLAPLQSGTRPPWFRLGWQIRHRPGLDVGVGIFNQSVVVGDDAHRFSRQRGGNVGFALIWLYRESGTPHPASGHLLPIRCGEGIHLLDMKPRAALSRKAGSFALGYYLLRFQCISVWNIRVNPC